MSVPFRKWDVVLLAYPFSDLTATKVRPAVVVSPDSENGKLEDSVFLGRLGPQLRRAALSRLASYLEIPHA